MKENFKKSGWTFWHNVLEQRCEFSVFCSQMFPSEMEIIIPGLDRIHSCLLHFFVVYFKSVYLHFPTCQRYHARVTSLGKRNVMWHSGYVMVSVAQSQSFHVSLGFAGQCSILSSCLLPLAICYLISHSQITFLLHVPGAVFSSVTIN